MNIDSEIFWKSEINELKKGYKYLKEQELYLCLICGKVFEKDRVFTYGNKNYVNEGAVKKHLSESHEDIFEYLLGFDRKYTGITEIQTSIMRYFHSGMDDNSIAAEMKIAPSTVRNHRFKLRERFKQAKILLALSELMDTKVDRKNKLIDIHKGAKMVDERYSLTEKEYDKLINNFFGNKNGKLQNFPKKEKAKIAVLKYITQNGFKSDMKYTEKEVNEILIGFYEDYAYIRRYLIEYGFLSREADCSLYWVNF